MSSAVAAVEQGVRELTLQDPVPVYSQETLHAVFSCVFEYLSPEDCLWARCSTLMRDIGNAEWTKRLNKTPSESVLREKEMSPLETLKEQDALRTIEQAKRKLKLAIEEERSASEALAQAKAEHVDVARPADDIRERIAALERETKVAHEAFEDAQRALQEPDTYKGLIRLMSKDAQRRCVDVRRALSAERRSSRAVFSEERRVLGEFFEKVKEAKKRRERREKMLNGACKYLSTLPQDKVRSARHLEVSFMELSSLSRFKSLMEQFAKSIF